MEYKGTFKPPIIMCHAQRVQERHACTCTAAATVNGAAIKGRNQQHLLQLSKLDFLLILQLKLPFVDRIHPQSNNFVASMKNKATGESKLDDSPGKQY